MRGLRTVCVGAVLLGWVPNAQADIELEGDTPRTFSIQPRPYRLAHEFQVGLGVLPLDAFYVGLAFSASYTFHFTDFWAWEIAGGGYVLDVGTGLEDELRQDFGVAPVRGGGERITFLGGSSLVVKPLFGKLALWNEEILYSETYFVLGVGPALSSSAGGEQDFWRFAANVGLGFRFWFNDSLSWRIDVRDYLIFKDLVPENTLSFNVSVSFSVAPEAE